MDYLRNLLSPPRLARVQEWCLGVATPNPPAVGETELVREPAPARAPFLSLRRAPEPLLGPVSPAVLLRPGASFPGIASAADPFRTPARVTARASVADLTPARAPLSGLVSPAVLRAPRVPARASAIGLAPARARVPFLSLSRAPTLLPGLVSPAVLCVGAPFPDLASAADHAPEWLGDTPTTEPVEVCAAPDTENRALQTQVVTGIAPGSKSPSVEAPLDRLDRSSPRASLENPTVAPSQGITPSREPALETVNFDQLASVPDSVVANSLRRRPPTPDCIPTLDSSTTTSMTGKRKRSNDDLLMPPHALMTPNALVTPYSQKRTRMSVSLDRKSPVHPGNRIIFPADNLSEPRLPDNLTVKRERVDNHEAFVTGDLGERHLPGHRTVKRRRIDAEEDVIMGGVDSAPASPHLDCSDDNLPGHSGSRAQDKRFRLGPRLARRTPSISSESSGSDIPETPTKRGRSKRDELRADSPAYAPSSSSDDEQVEIPKRERDSILYILTREKALRLERAVKVPVSADMGGQEENLYLSLALRGCKPVMPSTWQKDFSTLPESLFTSEDGVIEKENPNPLLKPLGHPDFHAIKAFKEVLQLGVNARDCRHLTVEPQTVTAKVIKKYLRWAMDDRGLKTSPETIPVHAIHVQKPGQRPLECLSQLTKKLERLALRFQEAIKDPQCNYWPTLIGFSLCGPVMTLVSLDSDPLASAWNGEADSPVKIIGDFDLTDKDEDVWNSLAVAICVIHARDTMGPLANLNIGSHAPHFVGQRNITDDEDA